MRLTRTTKYKDFAELEQYLQEGERKRITETAARCYLGDGGYYALNVSQFVRLCGNDINALNNLPIDDLSSVYAVYFFQGLREFIADYISQLAKLNVQQTPMEQHAAKGCLSLSLAEGLLIFCRDYFGLHSFAEAENVTLDELLIAKRDHYNKVTFERNTARIQTQKIKHEHRK